MTQHITGAAFKKIMVGPTAWAWAYAASLGAGSKKANAKALSVDFLNDIFWPAESHPQSEPVAGYRFHFVAWTPVYVGPGNVEINLAFNFPVALGGAGVDRFFAQWVLPQAGGTTTEISSLTSPILPVMPHCRLEIFNNTPNAVDIEAFFTFRAS